MLLHCGLWHSGSWRGIATALGDRLTSLAFDMPSHGKSAAWNGQGDIHDVVTDLGLGFLDRPRHLIGHSFGATVALRLALEHPDKVLTLTLIEPVLFAPVRDSDPALFKMLLAEMAPRQAALERGDLIAAAQAFLKVWGGGIAWSDLSDEQQAQYARQMPLLLQSDPLLTQDTVGLVAPGRLESLRLPVLLLQGDLSPPIIAGVHAALAARLPVVTQGQVAGAGHMLPITHPGPVADAIRAHLDRMT